LDDHNFILNQLIDSLESTSDLIRDLSSDVKDNAIALATLKTELKSLKSGVHSLSTILKTGNGKESVLTRIAVLEKITSTIEAVFTEIANHSGANSDNIALLSQKFNKNLDEQKALLDAKRESKKTVLQITIAIFAALVTIIGTIIAIIL